MDHLTPYGSRVTPVILTPSSAPYSELSRSQSNISRSHSLAHNEMDQYTLRQARWSEHRKKIGLSRLSHSRQVTVQSLRQRQNDLMNFVTTNFQRKDCVKFVVKIDPKRKKDDPIKCHCGETPECHIPGTPGVSEFFQQGVESSSKRLHMGAAKKYKSQKAATETDQEMDKEWNASKHIQRFPSNAYGKIDFINEGSGGRKPTKYVRLSEDTPMDLVIELMNMHWHMMTPTPPSLVITVIGGAKNFKLDGKKKEVFNRGLVKAAHTTHAWLITSGFNMGVMKAVGEAVQEGQSFNWDNMGMQHSLRCIGIAPWGYVENRSCLISKDGCGSYNASYKVNNVIRHFHPVPLNHNHTHLLLVDDGMRNRYGGVAEFRASLERKIALPSKAELGHETGLGIPVVLVVVEGGTDAIRDVQKSLQRRTPVVLCEGTGRAADILAYAFKHHITTRKGSRSIKQQHVEVMEDMLLEAYGKTWSQRSDEQTELQTYKKIVLDCCEDETLITVFDMNKGEELDLAILSALLKGQRATGIEQLHDQLKLSLTWNRSDIAEDKIFRDDVVWPTGSLDDVMTEALIEDKVDFVRLLLQHGVVMKEYLTVGRLRHLYNSAPKACHLRTQLVKANNSSRPFCLADVDRLLKKRMGKFSNPIYQADSNRLSSFDSFAREESMQITDSDNFPAPFRELFFWAVLLNRQTLAKFLWERGDEAIPSAISASRIYGSLAEVLSHADLELRNSYSAHKEEFEKLAVKVLDECNIADPEKASMLIERKYPAWGDLNCMEMAAAAEDKAFLSTVCCQNSLNLTWKRGIASSQAKIILGLLFPPFILCSIRFHNLGDEQEELSPFQKLLTFYRAPVTKFTGHTLLYLFFLILYSYMILFDFRHDVTVTEWIIICWIITLLFEEVREMFTSKADSLLMKISDYWNYSMFNRLDMLMIVVAMIGFGLRMGSYLNPDLFIPAKTLYAMNCVLFFLRLLRLYSANTNLGPKLVMIKLMLWELMQYATIMIVFVLGYGIACQSVMFPVRDPYVGVLKDIFYYPYWQIYGEVFLEEMEGTTDDCRGNETLRYDGTPCPQYSPLVPLLTAVYLLICNILLVNLLIAIFTHVFEKVQTNSIEVWKYEMYFLVVEYDNKPGLAPPFIIFEHIYLLIRWLGRRSCCIKMNKGVDLLQRYAHQLQVFEQEAVRSFWRKMLASGKQEMDMKINQIQARVDDMANMIEEERRLEQQHFEAQLNRTAPEGAENELVIPQASITRRRSSINPRSNISPRSMLPASSASPPTQHKFIHPPPITVSEADEKKYLQWPSVDKLQPLMKKSGTKASQPSSLQDITEVQSVKSDLSAGHSPRLDDQTAGQSVAQGDAWNGQSAIQGDAWSGQSARPEVDIGGDYTGELGYHGYSDAPPVQPYSGHVMQTDKTEDIVSTSSRPTTSSTYRNHEEEYNNRPQRPGLSRRESEMETEQWNSSTDTYTRPASQQSADRLFKRRSTSHKRNDSFPSHPPLTHADTSDTFDNYMLRTLETPTAGQRPETDSQSVYSDEKIVDMDNRLAELEDNTKRSLYNIETLLRNAVFNRSSVSLGRRSARRRERETRHRNMDRDWDTAM